MGFFSKIKKGLKKIGRAIGKVIGAIVGVVASPFSTSPSIPAMTGDVGAQIVDGVQLNFQGGAQPLPIVYGHRLVGGTRVFVSTNGTDNKYLYVAIAFCEGQCNGVNPRFSTVPADREGLIIDDTGVILTSYDHGVVATPTGGPYKDRLKVQFFDGRDDQVSASDGTGVFSNIDGSGGAPGWTTDHKLSGVCYYAMRFEWKKATTQEEANNNPYKGIPDIKVKLFGKRVFDAQNIHPTNPHTTAYADDTSPSEGQGTPRTVGQRVTQDPVSVLLDYLRNPLYGKGLPNDDIDFASFKAMSELNDTCDYYFNCDVVLNPNDSMLDNVKIILQSMRAYLPYSNGKFKLVIDKAEDSTLIGSSSALSNYSGTIGNIATEKTFTNDNIVGGITIEKPDKTSRYNRVRVTYADGIENAGSTESVFPENLTDATSVRLLREDNNEVLETSIALPWCTGEDQAKRFAEMFLNKSRNSLTVSFATNLSASNLIPTSLIRIVNTNFGIDGPFRIVDMNIQEDGLIVITAVEHQPSIFAQNTGNFLTQITNPVLNLPDPFTVSEVSNIAATTVTAVDTDGNKIYNLQVTWTDSTDPFLSEYVIDVKSQTSGATTSKYFSTDNSVLITGVRPGITYEIGVTARNDIDRSSVRRRIYKTVTNEYTNAGGTTTAVTSNSVTTTVGTGELSS